MSGRDDAPALTEAPTAPHPDHRRAVALVTGAVAAVLFVLLRVTIALEGEEPLAVDRWWHDLIVDGRSDVLVAVAHVPAVGGGTIGMILVGTLLIVVFSVLHRKWDAINVGAAIVIVVAIGAPMASVIGRERPTDSLAEVVDTSFPSGHTAVATTVMLTLALLLRRWYVWAAAVFWALLMAWSRTYLSAHWLTDVVGGLLEGIAVACLVWVAVEALRDRRARVHLEDPDRPGELPTITR